MKSNENQITILKEVNNQVFPNFIFIMARYLITEEEVHDVNGEFRLGLWDDPEDKDLLTCITKSGKVCFLKKEDAEEVGVLDVIRS